MPIDQQDFLNGLATLNLSPTMCLGFEDDAYGAMQGLLNFRRMGVSTRHAWDVAVATAAAERNASSGFRSSANVFYGALRQTRENTFGNGLDDTSIQSSDRLVLAPWCLSEAEFEYCFVYIRDGTEPVLKDYDRSLMTDDQIAIGRWSFSAGQLFLKTYYPTIMGPISAILERLTVPIFVGNTIISAVNYGLKQISKPEMIRRYEIDARRREYLRGATRGGGAYVASGGAR